MIEAMSCDYLTKWVQIAQIGNEFTGRDRERRWCQASEIILPWHFPMDKIQAPFEGPGGQKNAAIPGDVDNPQVSGPIEHVLEKVAMNGTHVGRAEIAG